MDFSKFDKMVDVEGLKKDIEAAEANGSGGFKPVPHGSYEVAIDKLELTETKQTGKPMATCWMKIVSDGEYKGQRIFMNQVITQGFQIHIMNEFLRSLLLDDTGIDITFALSDAPCMVEIRAAVTCTGVTGVEMESLTAVSVAALTIYDMCKAVQKDMRIENIRLLEKSGGKSGDYKTKE